MNIPTKLLLIFICMACLNGCAIREIAVTKLADTLSEGGRAYATDNDIELVGDALPFSLKTIESLLLEVPDHEGLLLTAASGFTQYSYAWVDLVAFETETTDPERAADLRLRAKNLYLRGRSYALRAVALEHPDFWERIRETPDSALSGMTRKDVSALYWLSLSWAAAIAADKSDMDMVADLNLIEPIIQRCLELDESYENGALHEFMISYQGGRSVFQGGGPDRARKHYQWAIELSDDARVAPMVALAESVSVGEQDRSEFERLLQKALAADVDLYPQYRLANLVAQKRARLLLAQSDDLFLED